MAAAFLPFASFFVDVTESAGIAVADGDPIGTLLGEATVPGLPGRRWVAAPFLPFGSFFPDVTESAGIAVADVDRIGTLLGEDTVPGLPGRLGVATPLPPFASFPPDVTEPAGIAVADADSIGTLLGEVTVPELLFATVASLFREVTLPAGTVVAATDPDVGDAVNVKVIRKWSLLPSPCALTSSLVTGSRVHENTRSSMCGV